MLLTTPSTIAGAVFFAVGVLAGTILLWQRWPRRVQLLSRTASLLLCQVMVLLVAGLFVNRAEELYPTLQTLIDPPKASWSPPETANSGNLDAWLTQRSEQGKQSGLTFTWQPEGEAPWPLAEPPTVRLPAQYFEHSNSRFPVIVTIAEPKNTHLPALLSAQLPSEPAVILTVRPARIDTTTMAVLESHLPQRLEQDLRILPDRWGTVGIDVHAKTAADLVAAPSGRYRTTAAIPLTHSPASLSQALSTALSSTTAQLPTPLEPPRAGGQITQYPLVQR